MSGPGRPALTVGLRGSLSSRIVVNGPPGDLHSGAFGGAVRNPIHVLAELVAALHDRNGRIRIDGFYDDVVAPSGSPRHADDDAIRRAAGVRALWGERRYSAYQRTTMRPALNVIGISGGHIGPGQRSAIPASARAVTNIRLVPNQCPTRVATLLSDFIALHTPSTVKSEVTTLTSSPAAVTPTEHPAVDVATHALASVFGRHPELVRSGGTIPAVSMIERELGATPILMGFGLSDDNTHAPNERAHVPTLLKGIDAVSCFLGLLGTTHADRSSGTIRKVATR